MNAMLIDVQIIRLYTAFFDRQPDQSGFDYWQDSLLQQKMSLQGVAESFSQSNEFIESYGNLNNHQFLNLVYQNVLGREPDAAGLTYWLNDLGNGVRRGDIMVSFSESTEHIERSSHSTAVSQLTLTKSPNTAAIFQDMIKIPLLTGNNTEESSALAAIDINGDGLLDLIGGRSTPILQDTKLALDLFINQGNGGFVTADLNGYVSGPLPSLNNTSELLSADFNGDGIDDMFIAGRGAAVQTLTGETNQLLLSDGENNWQSSSSNLPNNIDAIQRISTADIDKDGDLDILVASTLSSGSPYLLVNDGKGLFTKSEPFKQAQLIAVDPTVVHLADLNNDGAADMVIGGSKVSSPYVVFNDGNGAFGEQVTTELPLPDLSTSDYALDIQSLDVNGDGWLDLLVSSTRSAQVAAYDGNHIQILISQKGEYFIDETDARIIQQSSSLLAVSRLLVEDLNGDGYSDILAEQTGDYFLNDGRGVFSTQGVIANYNEGDGPFIVADFDNDQNVELIVTGVAEASFYS